MIEIVGFAKMNSSKRGPGRPPKKAVGKGRSGINFRIDAGLRRELVQATKDSNRSLAAQIEWCIRYALTAERTIGDVKQYERRAKRAIDIQTGVAPSPGRFVTEDELKAEIAALRKSIAESLMPPRADDDEAA
jgi:hypothetical protein